MHLYVLCVCTDAVRVVLLLPLSGQLDQVQAMLKESEALAKAKTKDGVTPLMRAANKGHVKVWPVSMWVDRFISGSTHLAIHLHSPHSAAPLFTIITIITITISTLHSPPPPLSPDM